MTKTYDVELIRAIETSGLVKPNTRKTGDYWGPFDCFICGKKDKMYTFAKAPHKFLCNSASCEAYKDTGGVSIADEIEFKYDFEKEHKKRGSSNDTIWQEYCKSRGLDETIKGLNAEHRSNIRKTGRGGVLFDAGKNVDGKSIKAGRIYRPIDGNKAHATGKITGCVVRHPNIQHDYNIPLHIVEGPFDMLSMEEFKQQSMGIISTAQPPSAIAHHFAPYKKLRLCFDWDPAGISCLKEYSDYLQEAEILMMDKGKDWNDFLRDNISNAEEVFNNNIERFKTNGRLALASSAHEYANTYLKAYGKIPGLFDFNGSTYHTTYRTRGKTEPTPKTERSGLWVIGTSAFINIGDNTENPEFLFRLKVKPQRGIPTSVTATHKDLNTPRDFNSFLLKTCKLTFEGNSDAMSALLLKITGAKAPTARKAKHYGYDPESKWWIANNFAVCPKGIVHKKNKEGLFRVNNKEYLIPADNALSPTIVPISKNPKHTVQEIYRTLRDAYPTCGPVVFAWYVGGLFINQIKQKIGFYPYLSLTGAADSGKSSLMKELQLLQAWKSEGLDISDAATRKGLSRSVFGSSGLFKAMLEVTPETKKILLTFINLLSGYNLGGGSVRAKFTNDNSVDESQMLCALAFSQNVEVWENKAQRSRVVTISFKDNKGLAKTLPAYERLLAIPPEDKASVLLEVLKKRPEFEASWELEYKIALADMEEVPAGRCKNNHALLLAIHRTFSNIFGIHSDIFTEVEELAKAQDKASNEKETGIVQIFFEQVFNAEPATIAPYWHEAQDKVCFNLNKLHKLFHNGGGNPPRKEELIKAFKAHEAYIKYDNHWFPVPSKSNERGTLPKRKQAKAWQFDIQKFKEIEQPPTAEEEVKF